MVSVNINEKKQAFMDEVSGTRKNVLDAAGKWHLGNDEVYTAAVHLGYLDMCRTCHGIGTKVSDAQRKESFEKLGGKIKGLLNNSSIDSQEAFDAKHKDLCHYYMKLLSDYQYVIKYGQAQKVVNMAFKYLFCCEDASSKPAFKYCHMPLDGLIMNWCKKEFKISVNSDKDAWSKLTEEKYTDITKAIFCKLKSGDVEYSIGDENTILPKIPLVAELVIWPEEARKKTTKELLTQLGKFCKDDYFMNNLKKKERDKMKQALEEILKRSSALFSN